MRRLSVALVVTLALLSIPRAAVGMSDRRSARTGGFSRNISMVDHFAYRLGTDIDFRGDSVYLMEDDFPSGTVRILDVGGKRPQLRGEFECGGSQNDVAAVTRSIIALGNHWGTCQGMPTSGVTLLDVTKPTKPRLLASVPIPGGTHTLTKHPTEPLIYTSAEGAGQFGLTREYVVDISDPERPIAVPTAMSGCHDISFHVSKREKLAFCAAGQLATEIWDVSNPMIPSVLARIVDRDIGYHHSAVATPDGDFLVVGDESADGDPVVVGDEPPADCSGSRGDRGPGALSIYDISDRESPELVSFINVPRGSGICWAHNYNFVPGTRVLVTSWYSGGASVYDLSNPAKPVEKAYFLPRGRPPFEVWSAYWYRGLIYTNGWSGAYVLDVKGLGPDGFD